MTSSIEIIDIKLTELEPEHQTPVMAASQASWCTLSVTVRNASSDPLYAISGLRRMSYDEWTRVLTVEFAERESPTRTQRPVRGPLAPKLIRVEPGQSVVLAARLSSPVVFLEPTAEGPLRQRQVRLLEDVDSVNVHVAFDRREPEKVGLTALRHTSPFADWGEVVRQSWTLGDPGDGQTGSE